MTGLVQPKWTERIHEEWVRGVVRRDRRISREVLERTRELMNAAVPDCLVEGYEPLISALELPDRDDRHVLAAAIHARAQTIVTENVKDFPAAALAPYGMAAERADSFILGLIDINPGLVASALRDQWHDLRHPPFTQERFLANLKRCGLVQTVAAIRPHL